jgi:O-antigen/teichoic acid export membrane protein
MELLKKLFARMHVRIFGYEPTQAMNGFIKNLSWSFIGVIGSVAVLFLVSIVGARLLGPEEYGKYNLAISLANIISVMCAFGFDQAAVKFTSESSDDISKRNSYYAMSLSITAAVSTLAVIVLLSARNVVSAYTGIEVLVLIAAGIYTLVLGIRQSIDVFFRGVHLFKAQAIVKIVEAFVSLIALLLVFRFVPAFGFTWYLAATTAVSALVVVVCFFIYLHTALRFWRKAAFMEMRPYAFSGVYISLIGILTLNLDRFFLNKSLGAAEVGIYSAYMLIPSMLANYFATAVVNVFFPTITQLPDKQLVLKRVRKLGIMLAVPITGIYVVLGYGILSLLGKQYRMDFLYLVLASAYGYLLIYVAMVAAVVGSSEKTYISYARSLLIKLAVVIVLYVGLLWLHLISIPMLILVLIAAVIIDIILFFRAGRLLG